MAPSEELTRLLDDLQPAELGLRDWVRTRMNASMVREIANLDYGMRADDHQWEIEELLAARRLPEEVLWPPREVLELSSHGRPVDARGHVTRLFSCLVLVRANDASRPAETLARLVESALELGPEATEQALRFLAWCRLHEPGTWRDEVEARPFLTLGLLLLYVMAPQRRDPAVAAALTRAFLDEVPAALPPEQWWPDELPTAMLRQTASGPGWRLWRALAGNCLPHLASSLEHDAQGEATEHIDTLRSWFKVGDR